VFELIFAGRVIPSLVWPGRATGAWGVEGELTLRAEANYSSRYYFTPDNIDLLSQRANLKGNLFATYKMDSGWSADVYVRNVGDVTTAT